MLFGGGMKWNRGKIDVCRCNTAVLTSLEMVEEADIRDQPYVRFVLD